MYGDGGIWSSRGEPRQARSNESERYGHPSATFATYLLRHSPPLRATWSRRLLRVRLCLDTFTAIVEGKPAPTIDNDFFLVLVPIVQHDSFLRNTFPKKSRIGESYSNLFGQARPSSLGKLNISSLMKGGDGWSQATLRAHMTKYRQLPYVERLADFNLLLYLCDFLDAQTEVAAICQSVASGGEIPLDSGFPLIIDSIAGLSS